MLIRVIIWTILFILAYRAVKYILQIMSGGDNSKNAPDTTQTFNSKHSSKFDIKKDDIIEADFEEIKDSEKDKSK